jgi:hypothetical protein
VEFFVSVPYGARRKVPTAAEQFSARPVVGQTLAGHAGAINTVAGIYARHWYTVHVAQRVETTADNLQGYVHATDGINQAAFCPVTIGPLDSAIQLAVLVSAMETGGSGAPSVTVTLDDLAGNVVDIGCVWSRTEGTLAALELPRLSQANTRRIEPRWQVTGDVRRAGLAVGATPSSPRALETSTTSGDVRGSVAVLRVVTSSCRIHAVAYLPVWGDVL